MTEEVKDESPKKGGKPEKKKWSTNQLMIVGVIGVGLCGYILLDDKQPQQPSLQVESEVDEEGVLFFSTPEPSDDAQLIEQPDVSSSLDAMTAQVSSLEDESVNADANDFLYEEDEFGQTVLEKRNAELKLRDPQALPDLDRQPFSEVVTVSHQEVDPSVLNEPEITPVNVDEEDLLEERRLNLHSQVWEGDVYAMYDLGELYANEYDDRHDEAFKYTMMAARNGHRLAMDMIADWYMEGKHTSQSDEDAYAWYTLSQAFGDKRAETKRAELTERMSQEQLNRGQEIASQLLRGMNTEAKKRALQG